MLRSGSSFLFGLHRVPFSLSRIPSGFVIALLGVFSFTVMLWLFASRAHAGQIWTDGNADGLPDDGASLLAAPGEVVSVDIWIDAQSFQWTNFLAYAEWNAGCFSYVSAQYLLSGGSNFPIDNFSHPSAIGFGGLGYDRTGVDAIGRVNLRLTVPVSCCLTPIIDPYNPYYVFSQLGRGESYLLFSSNPGSCWEPAGGPQACCFPDGSCSVILPADCAAQGGVFQGPGTTCATVNCPLPPLEGACCYPSGACTSFMTRAECEGGGGIYQGDGTDCSTVSCPTPTGACCFASGDCDVLGRDECESSGGTYRGDGVTCANANCLQPTGACCLPNGGCLVRTDDQCAALGGIYQGDGVSCANANCPGTFGACCFADGTCLIRTPFECADMGGIYYGNGTDCATVNCPVSQACCFPSRDCIDTNPSDCTVMGGIPQGPGSSCAQTNCGPPPAVGACCLLDGECAPSTTREDCEAIGGTYQGDGTICGVVACGSARIWTDGDFDGLPDNTPRIAALGDTVAADLWIDAGSFSWTNYLAYVEWPGACFGFTSAEYAITGGSNFPIDDFSHPNGIGFGGSGFNEGGVDRIGRFYLRTLSPLGCCVTPIIDPKNPYYVFSQLGSGSDYRLFADNPGSCWSIGLRGACCVPSIAACVDTTEAACLAMGGSYSGNYTTCSQNPCPMGACCVADSCNQLLTRQQCAAIGGTYRGNGSTCDASSCDSLPECGSFSAPGTVSLLRERFEPAKASKAQALPCLLTGNTNGTAANYRWYNVCSGYIWIYSGWRANEGVGVLYGGYGNEAVNCDSDIKRTITYYRNVCQAYDQTVDVYLDVATSAGCIAGTIASDLNIDPGLRWNCSEFGANIPAGVNYVVVRTQHDGGYSPSFATDGPFSQICDPNPPARSFYYGLNGSACVPWLGPGKDSDNFLNWLILDVSAPCVTAVQPTSWGKIKGLFR